nr:hypothetical protein [uncultured Sphingomonas sp.]
MRNLDFTDWHSVLATLVGLALFTLIGVGTRLLVMMTIQQRRERMNRQINERLRTLIAAYKTLGGSFTGDLTVDPTHLRDLRRRSDAGTATEPMAALDLTAERAAGSERTRRIRDAVEAALSDIILLGTEQHVRLARQAVEELVAGRPVHTHALVVALRDFIREALGLDPIPADLAMPLQGPSRPTNSGARGKEGERGGGGGGGGVGGGGMGGGMGGMGMGGGTALEDDAPRPRS